MEEFDSRPHTGTFKVYYDLVPIVILYSYQVV